jgi:hypothetical protein
MREGTILVSQLPGIRGMSVYILKTAEGSSQIEPRVSVVKNLRPLKYQLPEFLSSMKLTQTGYERWLSWRAAAHVKRDRKRGNITATIEAYKIAIHSAVLHSSGKDYYTGECLDWALISQYSNVESEAKGRHYKAALALLPSVDHVGDGLGEADFKICAWRTNDAKHDLTHQEFVALCRRVVEHFDQRTIASASGKSGTDGTQIGCPMTPDYGKFYDLERYLFIEVGPRFARTGDLSPADFYMIVIWKANRAKTKVRDRLDKREGGFAAAVKCMAASLHASAGSMQKLKVVMKGWGFALPMATAILTVLYPDDFSVYDVRVCGQVEGGFEKLANRQFSDDLWTEYQKFLNAVRAAAPEKLGLRDKDRYLWGRSFYEGVGKELRG